MKPTVIALAVATLSVFAGTTAPALAEEAKVARGTVSSIGPASLIVKVNDQDMKFAVDSQTTVEARGGSTKSARAAAEGKKGPHLSELLTAGQPVTVTYSDAGGALHANTIRSAPISTLGSNREKTDMTSAGIVKAIGADWITINGRSGAGASFEQTFKIDSATKVFAKGAGTASAANGGKVPFGTIVLSGDHVSVSYHKQNGSLVASDVHVTMKAAH